MFTYFCLSERRSFAGSFAEKSVSSFPKMSNLDLLCAGFTAVFGNGWKRGTAGCSLDDLIRNTYFMPGFMKPPAEGSDCIRLFIHGITGKSLSVCVPRWYTVAQLRAVCPTRDRSSYERNPTYICHT